MQNLNPVTKKYL